MIDLTEIPLAELWNLDDDDEDQDDALAAAIRRVTAPAGQQQHRSVSAFNSAI